ncbi:MAG: hypothetical protein ACR2OU_13555 [Thermomicrobiales bacterium]
MAGISGVARCAAKRHGTTTHEGCSYAFGASTIYGVVLPDIRLRPMAETSWATTELHRLVPE